MFSFALNHWCNSDKQNVSLITLISPKKRMYTKKLKTYQWLSAKLQYLQCISNENINLFVRIASMV